MTGSWLIGVVRRRPARLVGTATGIAIAVALLATLASFLAHSKATMTDRAVRGVSVDWQVQVQQGSDVAAARTLVQHTTGVSSLETVGYARTTGLGASLNGSTQQTGPGMVLGLSATYRTTLPREIRLLAGSAQGALLFQQTASNLRAAPGDAITVGRAGLPPVRVTVAGVVDLPHIDSVFQTVGAPPGAGATAPPDNVLLLPDSAWHSAFDPLGAARPDLVSTQFHVIRDHALPADPAAAYGTEVTSARNLEAQGSGSVLVGDNLGAALDAARSDAAYAQVLFLFLGVPGAVVAALLTAVVAGSGATRRRNEQALLRARGASARQVVRLAAGEAAAVGVLGSGVGLLAALVVGRIAFGSSALGTTTSGSYAWAIGAAAAGLAIAAVTVLGPVRRDLRSATVAAGRATVGAHRYPVWARIGIDIALLVVAALVYRASSSNGYQLVLAPEGVPTISVSYWAFLGPALLWIGAGLLAWRLGDLVLGRGRPVVRRLLAPLTGRLAGPVSGTVSRQRRPIVRAAVLLALGLSFAASTATFNATYKQQAEADAQLTNGADVAVTVSAGTTVHPQAANRIASVPGVRAVEPVQHRYAYIGSDLQDLYGVRPDHIRSVTALQDAYFHGGTAAALMHTLATRPDSILVSAETVLDYQLKTGDLLRLRLPDARTGAMRTVPFHYVGVVDEFPTAPKDSFFVTNAAYVAQQTGSDSIGTFLVDTGGTDTSGVATRLHTLLGTSAQVTDIATVRGTVGSSLAAVDLAGLTRVELSFALVLVAASSGLVLALGLAERRRVFAIVTVLGARRRHLRSMIAAEALVVAALGLSAGAVIGTVLSRMLVKVLTGVFDPPPASIPVPWTYLGGLVGTAAVAFGATVWVASVVTRRGAVTALRGL